VFPALAGCTRSFYQRQDPFGGMHTAAFRANALLTFAGTALAVLAALASVTGARWGRTRLGERLRQWLTPCGADLWHKEAPVLDVQLVKVERLHALDSGNDEVRTAAVTAVVAAAGPERTRRRRI